MASETPRSARVPHTPRMSERKRGLFQPPSASRSPPAREDSDSCDLGIMSPIDSSSSSEPFDQSVPQTPHSSHSWRISTRSSKRKEDEKRTRRTAREILNSPLTFKNYMSRHSDSFHSTRSYKEISPSLNLTASADSCSNSLQDLNFNTESDLSDSKENTPKKRPHRKPKNRRSKRLNNKITHDESMSISNNIRLSLKPSPLKNLNVTEFHLPDELKKYASNTIVQSPSYILKTPHDTAMHVESPPRIGHNRRSGYILHNSPILNTDNKKRNRDITNGVRSLSPRPKNPRLDNGPAPRARLSLFNNSDVKHFISAKSFYPKSSPNLDISFISETKISPASIANKSVKHARHSLNGSRKPSYKRRVGEINMGVRHGIRKPKPSKNSQVSRSDALKLALNIIENSPLNDYISEFMATCKSTTAQCNNVIINNVEKTVTDADITSGTGLSQMQLQKMDTILKDLGCATSLNNILNHKPIVEVQSAAPICKEVVEDVEVSDQETISKNKFFKSTKSLSDARKATVKLTGNIRLQVKNGKMYLPEKKQKEFDACSVQQKLSMLQSMVQCDMSDLTDLNCDEDDENDNLDNPERQSIDALLRQWSEEEIPDDEPHVTESSNRVIRSIEEVRSLQSCNTGQLGNTSPYSITAPTIDSGVSSDVPFSNGVPDDNNCDTNSSDDGICLANDPCTEPTNASNIIEVSGVDMDQGSTTSSSGYEGSHPTCDVQFLPSEGGYYIIEDVEMTYDSDVPCDLQQINSELERLDQQISEMAKLNNINPQVLLSPTTQMCSMASDLALNSPKVEIMQQSSSFVPESPPSERPSPSASPILSSSRVNVDERQKLYPLFIKESPSTRQKKFKEEIITPSKGRKAITTKKFHSLDQNQYIIDAGQKNFGATQCTECGVIYQIGDAEDEKDHMTHHLARDLLKFQGWKVERQCGRWGSGRAIVVSPGDPTSHWQRVNDLLSRVVHPQLGYASALDERKNYKVYLYIDGKNLVGCLVAEWLQKAHKLLSNNDLDCCTIETFPVKCGISRIWIHKSHRRKGIATNLVNSMRANFMFGHVLAIDEIAFSSPTLMGRSFAENYTGTSSFYVYLN